LSIIEDNSAADDRALPFQVEGLDVRGRVVTLGPSLDAILQRHDFPAPVKRLVGEAAVLASLLATSLKDTRRFILQTQTDGPVSMIVVDVRTPGQIRATASFDKAAVAEATSGGRVDPAALLGRGSLAMTVEQGQTQQRYQGYVPLQDETLEEAAHTYFRQSEQIPTFIRLAVARHYGRAEGAGARAPHWRAGGLMIQQLPREGGMRVLEGDAHDSSLEGDDDENWNRARHLAATVEDHELLDPTLSPDRLLYRLFHEEGVRVVPATDVTEACRCSRERIELYLKRFGVEELADLREPDGSISVTCEFCSRKYPFASGEFA
jgi:molecular chaperone Hsp33